MCGRPSPRATSDSTASSCTAPTAISSTSSSGNAGKPTITVGSVGLDLEFLRQLSGETAHSARLDALLERLDNGEFDLVAVGRALLGDSAWANKIRDGRENEIVTFTPEHAATLT